MHDAKIPGEGEWAILDRRTGRKQYIGGTHAGDVWPLEDYQEIVPWEDEDDGDMNPVIVPPEEIRERRSDDSALSRQEGGNHYASRAIQPVEYATANGFGYCESLALRYITRHRQKNGREDVEKAIHCLELLLETEYPKEAA